MTRETLENLLDLSWRRCGSPRAVLAAFSGGADSTALLLGLRGLSARTGFRLAACCVDHALRKESADEAAGCEALCRDWGIPFFSARLRPESGGENEARTGRYRELLRFAQENGCECIALAHHLRDQAENVLMRLMEGSLRGMSAMAEKAPCPGSGNVFLWRPLLECDPEDLRSLLLREGIRWWEDASNQDPRYLRNFIRTRVLPLMEERQKGLTEHIAAAGAELRGIREYLTEEADRFITGHGCVRLPCPWLEAGPLQALHPALGKAVIIRFFERCGLPGSLPRDSFDRILSLAPGQGYDVSGASLFHSSRLLHLSSPRFPFPSAVSPVLLPYNGSPGDGKHCQAMKRAVAESLSIRFRRPGDRIRPLGMAGSRKLQDYLTDRKIPRPFRDAVPLMCDGDTVVWAVGVGPGEEARAENGGDNVLVYYPERLPWEK